MVQLLAGTTDISRVPRIKV